MEWRKDSVTYQWKIGSVLCQWRTNLDASQCRTGLDLSGKTSAKDEVKIGMIGTTLAHAQLMEDLPDMDLCSPDIAMNVNESSA